MELEKKVYMQLAKRWPVTIVRGKGMKVWDDKGREYLDFVAGIAVTSLGHCHPMIVKALTRQAKTLIQMSNMYYTVPQLQLADLLVKTSCLDRVFICNSGAEANEGAIKLARRYGKLKLDGAYEIITTHESFHGRTLATTAATGQNQFQEPYTPLPTGFINVDYNDLEAIKAATNKLTCAVMLEPIQGEGGVNVPSDDYLKKVRAWCDEKRLLLILDEVQTGIARTGTLYAYQQYGAEPDIMTLAKGLGGGVPIGAFLAKERACVFKIGEHGTTFGGNPLVCATAFDVLSYIIKKDLASHVQHMGEYLRSGLNNLAADYKIVREVRGKGLLVALQFNAEIAEPIVLACLDKGLIVNKVKADVIRFIPPLIVTEKDIDRALDVLGKVLKERQ
ncbi:MAG: aspartate aminotransferase family protein [Dehalococcoidia bacterium]|nr:aspartate aminotransferase family protein [Dehalococcoidia bacterium]MDD5648022.1 aspartate aminotransferase family protein [Dehalococcoidia bacterium]